MVYQGFSALPNFFNVGLFSVGMITDQLSVPMLLSKKSPNGCLNGGGKHRKKGGKVLGQNYVFSLLVQCSNI
jgi:hypothetical protein